VKTNENVEPDEEAVHLVAAAPVVAKVLLERAFPATRSQNLRQSDLDSEMEKYA
jgi:hypothetical protein